MLLGYDSFVSERVFAEPSISWSQWGADVSGYVSLLSGLSVFSVLLLPLSFRFFRRFPGLLGLGATAAVVSSGGRDGHDAEMDGGWTASAS